ncbi:MAG: hypothetical protein ACKKL4_02395 [Patescibacteria group bacterium]
MHKEANIHKEKSEIQKAFEDFQKTRFYAWLDGTLTGRFKWLILPITGLIDAFLVVLPTEAVVAMYMLRHPTASWWYHTIVVSFFASVGYFTLGLIVSLFGIDAISWLSGLIGSELAEGINYTITNNLILLGASAGITSFFPMPATAFSVTVGLLGGALIPMTIGIFMGKCVRFGIFAYGASRFGKDMVEYYFTHANLISLVLVVFIVLYLFLV